MLSRVADAIYWSSRYVERAENVARFIEVSLNLMLDTPVQKAMGVQKGKKFLLAGDHLNFTRSVTI